MNVLKCVMSLFLKMWVRAFRIGLMEIVVNTNNGVERQNKDLKHEYLKDYRDNSLSGMITVLVERFLPEKFRRYYTYAYFFISIMICKFITRYTKGHTKSLQNLHFIICALSYLTCLLLLSALIEKSNCFHGVVNRLLRLHRK